MLLPGPDFSSLRGSAYANTISQFVQMIFLFLYIVLKKLYLETWAGAKDQAQWVAGEAETLKTPHGQRTLSEHGASCLGLPFSSFVLS